MEIILWTSLGLLYVYCYSHRPYLRLNVLTRVYESEYLIEAWHVWWKLNWALLFLSGFSYKVSTASLPFLCLSSLMFSALHLVNCKSRGCRLQDLDNLCYFALRISGPPDHFYYLPITPITPLTSGVHISTPISNYCNSTDITKSTYFPKTVERTRSGTAISMFLF